MVEANRILSAVAAAVLVSAGVFVLSNAQSSSSSGSPSTALLATDLSITLPPLQDWQGTSASPRNDVFVFGHSPTPDCDSIGASIGLAELFHIKAACPVDQSACYFPNVRHWLDTYGPKGNQTIVESLQTMYKPSDKLVTIDFHVRSQLPSWLNQSTANYAAAIDSHELDAADMIDMPVLILRNPATIATSTMVAWEYFTRQKTPSKFAAAMMLAGIIDDSASLNPISGYTSTDLDAANRLAKIVGISSLQDFGLKNFQLKSSKIQTEKLTDVLSMDMKAFQLSGKTLIWGTVETTKDGSDQFLQRPGLKEAADQLRKSNGATWAIFSVVDVLDNTRGATRLLTGDPVSRALVERAFASPTVHVDKMNGGSVEPQSLALALPIPKADQDFVHQPGCKCISRAQYMPVLFGLPQNTVLGTIANK